MLDYIKKFNQLPIDWQKRASSKQVLSAIDELEKKYGLPLAALVMKVMIKEVNLNELVKYFNNAGLDKNKAEQLAQDFKNKVLSSVIAFLTPTEVKTAVNIDEGDDEYISYLKKTGRGQQTVKGASFFFSPEDEEEIRELTKKVDGYRASDMSVNQTEIILDNILQTTKINFGSVALANRFEQILITYLRGIRDRIEVKQTLLKPFTAGGLNFDPESAEKVLKIADQNFKNYSKKKVGSEPEKIKATPVVNKDNTKYNKTIARDVEYDLASILAKKNLDKKVEIDPEHELAPLTPVKFDKAKVERPKPAVADNLAFKNLNAGKNKSGKNNINVAGKNEIKIIFRRQGESDNRVKIEDVKYVPRVMGPIDELKYMDLVSFRRLDKDPIISIMKIKNKIKLLEDEGYAKRLEGIKAWRSSPLVKLYISMGSQSISENKPVDVIIKECQAKGQECLSQQEFEAIMDINKSLRF